MAERVHLDPAEIVAHLAATGLFALLDPAALALLAQHFLAVRYGPGQLIARQGETDATLWVVIDGQVSFDRRASDGRIEHLGFRGYGTVIGERGVFAGERRPNSVLPIEPTTLLYVDGESLWRALQADPAIFDRLVLPDTIRQRLAMTDDDSAIEGERRVAIFRRHWIILVRGMSMPLIVFALAVILAIVLAPVAASPSVILILAVVAVGAPLVGAVWTFFDYRYDCLIVTNRRVIRIERKPLIDARRSEAPLARIQDVRVTTPSLMARLVGLGDIRIQTAGTRGAIEFTSVPNPEAMRELIFEQVDQAQEFARRERLAWIASQIRVALGREAPGAASPRSKPDESLDDLESAAVSIPTLVGVVVRLVARLLPRMRQQDGSVVTWRKHWWILLKSSWFLLLPWLALTAILVSAMLRPLAAWPWQWLAGAWVLILAWLWWQLENWRNDLYQLTDDHIIDIERLPLGFFEDRRQAKLSQIQDIRYTVPNPLATVLNFGNVMIETAAESGHFSFDYVYNPAGVQEEIFARLERQRSLAQQADEERRAEEMTRWLTQYHRIAAEARDEATAARRPPGVPSA